MKDIYKDEKNDVLINKLGIKDSKKLEQAEYDIVSTKASFIDEYCSGNFDIEHLKNLNKYLFGDVYEWAGKFRSVPIWKDEKVFGYMDSVRYSAPEHIEKDLKKIFNYYDSFKWNTLSFNETQDLLIDMLSDIWKVHPFREGNTRSCVSFICLYAESMGVSIDKTLFSENPDYMRNALVYACDGQYSDKSYLTKIMKDSMQRKLSDPTISDNRDDDYKRSVKKDILKSGFKPTDKIIDKIEQLHKLSGKNISVKEIKNLYTSKNVEDKETENIVKDIAKEFIKQEKAMQLFFERER